MKKLRLLCMACVAALFMTGCQDIVIESPYPVYSSPLGEKEEPVQEEFFAKDLCITDGIDFGTERTNSEVVVGEDGTTGGAGLFNLDTREILYSHNLLGKLYPASTTKILTAYIIIKYGNLEDTVTVSQNAANQDSESSVCGIRAGDVVTVRTLLYGLLLPSGNDAAVALAEYFSGSEEAFAQRMNEEARRLGATGSHFVNASGLPDAEHYTTIYDMYLFMSAAVKLDTFLEITGTPSMDVTINNENGSSRSHAWRNGNQYINGLREAPEGVTILCGKTGTTREAGYCLVVYGRNSAGEGIVSIVFKADARNNLYLLMGQILGGFAN